MLVSMSKRRGNDIGITESISIRHLWDITFLTVRTIFLHCVNRGHIVVPDMVFTTTQLKFCFDPSIPKCADSPLGACGPDYVSCRCCRCCCRSAIVTVMQLLSLQMARRAFPPQTFQQAGALRSATKTGESESRRHCRDDLNGGWMRSQLPRRSGCSSRAKNSVMMLLLLLLMLCDHATLSTFAHVNITTRRFTNVGHAST